MKLLEQLLDGSGYSIRAGDTTLQLNHSPDVTAVLIRSQTKITHEILQTFPKLQHVIRAGTGLDNVDVEFCQQQGIAVHNAPGANSESVADYTIMAMLLALRKIHTITPETIQGWNRERLLGQSLSAQTVGIVGYGNIGRQVHERLMAFGSQQVLIHDPILPANTELPERSQLVDLGELLQSCSIITLHVPLLPETKHMINRSTLQPLQNGTILVNAARGGLVDEEALLDAMNVKPLTYVADSVENEPRVRPELLDNPNVIITPHIAGYTQQSHEQSLTQAIKSLLTYSPRGR